MQRPRYSAHERPLSVIHLRPLNILSVRIISTSAGLCLWPHISTIKVTSNSESKDAKSTLCTTPLIYGIRIWKELCPLSSKSANLGEIKPSPSNSVIVISLFSSDRVYLRIALLLPSPFTVTVFIFSIIDSGFLITMILLSLRMVSLSLYRFPLVKSKALYAYNLLS